MMNLEDAYGVLGLGPGATEADIRRAHRELAQILHPDRFGDDAGLRARAEEQMKRVNVARDTLLHDDGDTPGPSESESNESARPASREIFAILFTRLKSIESDESVVQQYMTDARNSREIALAWMAGGAVLTAAGYYLAAMAESGQTFLVFWGALAWGVYRLVQALLRLRRARKAWRALQTEKGHLIARINEVERLVYGKERTTYASTPRVPYSSKWRAFAPVALTGALLVAIGFGALANSYSAGATASATVYGDAISPFMDRAQPSLATLDRNLELMAKGGSPSVGELNAAGTHLQGIADELDAITPNPEYAAIHQELVAEYRCYGRGASALARAASSDSEAAWNRANDLLKEGDTHAAALRQMVD